MAHVWIVSDGLPGIPAVPAPGQAGALQYYTVTGPSGTSNSRQFLPVGSQPLPEATVV